VPLAAVLVAAACGSTAATPVRHVGAPSPGAHPASSTTTPSAAPSTTPAPTAPAVSSASTATTRAVPAPPPGAHGVPAAPPSGASPSPPAAASPLATTTIPTTTTTATVPATSTTTTPSEAALAIRNFAFLPSTLVVSVGTTVTVTNDDSVGHTWTSTTGVFDSGPLGPGASYSVTFTVAGTYQYHCNVHTFMVGTVVVQ
jgi:plastocyanin